MRVRKPFDWQFMWKICPETAEKGMKIRVFFSSFGIFRRRKF